MAESIDILVDNPGDYAFNRLYTKLQELVSEELDLENITSIVVSLMQFVQTIGGLTGSEKKSLVIRVIQKFIAEEVGDNDLSLDLQTFAGFTLPGLIDSIIALNNGEVVIKVKGCLKRLFKKCCTC